MIICGFKRPIVFRGPKYQTVCCDMCGGDTNNKSKICTLCWGGVMRGLHNDDYEETQWLASLGYKPDPEIVMVHQFLEEAIGTV